MDKKHYAQNHISLGVDWTSGTYTLPNETGVWEITGVWTGAGNTGGILFDLTTTADINSTSSGGWSQVSRIGVTGSSGDQYVNIRISHQVDELLWHISGDVSMATSGAGRLFHGVKTTTASSTSLSTIDLSSFNLKVRRIS